jgi:hypothetical protein
MDILQKAVMDAALFEHFVRDLWTAMNNGTISVALGKKLLRFNGNIFANPEVLPLTKTQIGILLEAARANWKEVEPAIFGTLLERALEPKERHKLGAHYTPRAYVERLVIPTVMQPLRQEWDDVQAAASLVFSQGKEKEARKTVADFHTRLLKIRVLDPACGSGNFLYVTLEHMKRLEGEVLRELASYGEQQQSLLQVDPHQFLGLEINPRASHIAEMVLWIGYLQWHFRTHGNVSPPEPVIKKFDNIQNQDALISYKGWKYATDKSGKPITRWDGESYKTDPTTGRQVPDETATTVGKVYEGERAAAWPKADFIVGNPPFVGGGMKRGVLGHGYFDALSKTYPELPEACDLVMYWWHKAAELARRGKIQRFGFITTNSITQVFNRRVVAMHVADKKPLHLAFAIPDHPWVDASDGAAVRIAMTVGEKCAGEGILALVAKEHKVNERERAVSFQETLGIIHADLRQGVDITQAVPLQAADGLVSQGMKLHGRGFVVSPDEAQILGRGRTYGLERHIRPFCGGRDITEKPRGVMAIDLFGLTAEQVRDTYPAVYQWVYTRVKPERDAKATNSKDSAQYAAKWWLFGKPREIFRPALVGLSRYIVTVYVSKHRFFLFLPMETIPEDGLIAIASADAYHLGVLSSRIHVCWSLAAGGRLGVGNDPRYNNSVCFVPFPFPAATQEQQARIRDLGEKLDAHRKAQQERYPDLTMTGMYNVLEALRSGRELTAKEKNIHEHGLVTVLRQLHDELDAVVAEAYGWPIDLPDEEILSRLVALNAERVEEEKNGLIRWLRPEYQTRPKAERKMVQNGLGITLPDEPDAKDKNGKATKAKQPWPSDLLEQTQAVRGAVDALREKGFAMTANSVAECFIRAPRARVEEILRVLESLGFVDLYEIG